MVHFYQELLINHILSSLARSYSDLYTIGEFELFYVLSVHSNPIIIIIIGAEKQWLAKRMSMSLCNRSHIQRLT